MINQEIQVQENNLIIYKKMDSLTLEIQAIRDLGDGFEKTFKLSRAIQELRKYVLSNKNILDTIVSLQGSSLGFRTDKDNAGGYKPEEIVDAVIEAVFYGAKPTGNQFNIISKKCYLTREYFRDKLNNYSGLIYDFAFPVPTMHGDGTATQRVKITWSLNGEKTNEKLLEFSIRVNANMGADAVLGKAERKSGKWLLEKLNNTGYPDSDAGEIVQTIPEKTNSQDLLKNISEKNK